MSRGPGALVVTFVLTAAFPATPSLQTAPAPSPGPRIQETQPAGTPRIGMPPRDASVTKAGTGRIRGRVLTADTNAPLRRAQVNLNSGQLGVRRFTTTDEEGRYEFVELAEGRYNITASKGGYVSLQYGQRRAFEPGRPIALADGQLLAEADLALPRGSVIAGRITDEFGEAIAGAQVQVQRYQYGPSGQRRLTFAGGSGLVLTNDLGEFRAYGLMPGEYIVSGTLRQPMFQQGANPNDAREGFAPTYYPGTPDPGAAGVVTVGLGQETLIQLALQAGRMARISGTITDSAGRPLTGVTLMLRSRSGPGTMFNGGIAGPDGSFTLSNVPPGEHSIDVVATETRTPDSPSESASVPLTVGNQDITNLRITTAPPATVSGTVVFEGSSPRTGVMGGLRVIARPTEPENPGAMMRFEELGRVNESGAFLLRGVGDVFFRPINLGPWVLKSVTLNGDDITDTAYPLRASQSVEGLRVVLTDRVTDVSGSVTGERSAPVKDFVVVIQPVRSLEGTTLQRFLQTARPDQDGRFRVRGMPPGDYVATAIEALEQGREWDPEYRPQLREAGRRFSIKEGASIDLSLTLAPGL